MLHLRDSNQQYGYETYCKQIDSYHSSTYQVKDVDCLNCLREVIYYQVQRGDNFRNLLWVK